MSVVWKSEDPELMLFEDPEDDSGMSLILHVGIEDPAVCVPITEDNIQSLRVALLKAGLHLEMKAEAR